MPQKNQPGPAVNDALRTAAAQLRHAGVEQARLDARLLLMAATGLGAEDMIRDPDAELSPHHVAAYAAMIARRAAREPVSRILQRREFWSLDFEISPETLDPRPDSETLIRAALGAIGDHKRPLHILDIGAGCGCLLLALLSELPGAQGVGADISSGALDVARRNAARLGLQARARFMASDVRGPEWTKQAGGPFDIVIANPPYIENAAIKTLAPEVSRYDPYIALAGGEDGLDFYRIITISLAQLLYPDGMVIFEAGIGQSQDVRMLLHEAGMLADEPLCDLGGVARAIIGRRQAKTAL